MYDASLNTTPDAQGWVYVSNPLVGAQASQSVAGGILSLNTRSVIGEQAGYFSKIPAIAYAHPDHPTIDLSVSPFSIEFTMRQVDGSDTVDADPLALGQRNRGGFAVMVITDDLRGIEIQFQTDHIVALDNANTAFPVGEVEPFDTTAVLHDYELGLSANGYQLVVDGSVLLEGPLRDYTSIAPAQPIGFPYNTPSFLFFGDDTGRGEALTELTRFAVAAVPEPTTAQLLMLGAIWAVGSRRTNAGRRAICVPAISSSMNSSPPMQIRITARTSHVL